MAMTHGSMALAFSLMAALVALLALAGGASAADAPAPSPASGAGSLSPPLVAVLVSFAAFLLGSLRQ